MGKPVSGLSIDAYQVLKSYHWPGNVRELQNAVRRAVAMTRSATADVEDLPDDIVAAAGRCCRRRRATTGFFAQRAAHVARFERQFLTDLLTRHQGDVSAAAREAKLPAARSTD
jgi:DNA-binding NtrC family response regulator